ncbi:MAG: hypothetical protein HQL54_00635 [Magnetococcales bacterium]|nr:hypothetical protein [Magnetococcales bacterium]
MRYLVDMFDGKEVRKYLVDENKLAEFQYRINRMDPLLGVTILSATPEDEWLACEAGSNNSMGGLDRDYPLGADYGSSPNGDGMWEPRWV